MSIYNFNDTRLPSIVELALMGKAGRYWYTDAHATVKALAASFGVSVARVAGVASATSPRVHVKSNIALTLMYLRGARPIERDDAPGKYNLVCPTTGTSRGILRSTVMSLAHFERTGELRGPKVAAFMRAISGDQSVTVVDVWAFRAYAQGPEGEGEVWRKGDPTKGEPARVMLWRSFGKARYRKVVAAYERASELLGWPPSQVQAAVWYATRQAYGLKGSSEFKLS